MWGLFACRRGGEIPSAPARPLANSSLGSVAPIERIIGPLTPTEAAELKPAPKRVASTAPNRSPAAPSPNKTTPPVQPAGKVVQPSPRPPAPIAAAPKPAAPPTAAITLDLEALKKQLKETKAIGIFTKISLKNQVDDLLGKFRDYYENNARGKSKFTLMDLRESYNLLMMKALSLLQKNDPALAAAIVSSREAIWGLLADPKKFATLQV